jgi:1-deoxy-D-xylulose-5-phosphate reductoisomerase
MVRMATSVIARGAAGIEVPRRQRIAILGATGSIGGQALDVIDRFPDRFEVFGLVSGRRSCDRPARYLLRGSDPDLDARIEEMVTHPDCDLVLVAIPGARSLRPTLAALSAGKRIALATKEVLVMAGDLVMARAVGDAIRPVDSEHSAIWQCLWGEAPQSVARLILTASGGPFWRRPDLDWDQVTVEQALAHPRWSMGPKVTVDCATLMNKGLELVEAHQLFGLPLDRVDVTVHPQSVIHSMVEFVDGSAKAQLSNPDMRLPIGLALSYPERLPGVVPPTSFQDLGELELCPLDHARFPAVGLAREAARRGAPYPAVLNAADEEAVAAFMAGAIRFSEIVPAVEAALDSFPGGPRGGSEVSLEEILEADQFARRHVQTRAGHGR